MDVVELVVVIDVLAEPCLKLVEVTVTVATPPTVEVTVGELVRVVKALIRVVELEVVAIVRCEVALIISLLITVLVGLVNIARQDADKSSTLVTCLTISSLSSLRSTLTPVAAR